MSLTLSARSNLSPAEARATEPSFRHLTPPAHVTILLIVGAGTVALGDAAVRVTLANPLLFVFLLLLSGIAAVLRVAPPPAGESTSVSLASAVDFGALLLLGPHAAACIAASSAVVQCTAGETQPQRLYRTAVSVAAAVLSVEGAGVVYHLLGGTSLLHLPAGILGAERAIVAAAATQYALNIGLVLGTSMSINGARLPDGWKDTLLWSGLGFSVGAGAASACILLAPGAGVLLTPLAAVPVFLVYRAHHTFTTRTTETSARLAELSDLDSPILSETRVFDVYEGPQVPPGTKSVAFGFTFRGERTLTDEEVDADLREDIETLDI